MPTRRFPLDGRTILVTRPEGQAKRLVDALLAEGARPLEVPVIKIEPPNSWDPIDRAIAKGGFDWVVFTSGNGVRYFFERLGAAGAGRAWFGDGRVAAIGPETARSLADRGVEADLVPDEYVAEALVAALADAEPLIGRRVLLPRADVARDALDAGLTRAGAIVEKVVAYRTVQARVPDGLEGRLRAGKVDAVTFTSSSTVRSLVRMLGGPTPLAGMTVACIGPVTAATAAQLGIPAAVVARTYTISGLVAALRDFYAPHPDPPPQGGRG